MVETQSGEQTQNPTGEVEHAVHEPTPVAVEHAQQDHDDEQDIDRVDGHVRNSLPADYTDPFTKICVICGDVLFDTLDPRFFQNSQQQ